MNKLSIAEVDMFIKQNKHTFGADMAIILANQLADTMRENKRLQKALEDVVSNIKQHNSEIGCACNGLCEDIATQALNPNKESENG